jgi:hypothetical protein
MARRGRNQQQNVLPALPSGVAPASVAQPSGLRTSASGLNLLPPNTPPVDPRVAADFAQGKIGPAGPRPDGSGFVRAQPQPQRVPRGPSGQQLAQRFGLPFDPRFFGPGEGRGPIQAGVRAATIGDNRRGRRPRTNVSLAKGNTDLL